MTCKGYLIGVVSFGGKCGESPGVYTRLTGYTAPETKIKFAYCCSFKIHFSIQDIFILLASSQLYYYAVVNILIWVLF